MKKTFAMILVLLLAVSLFSFTALADDDADLVTAPAPELVGTAPAPDLGAAPDGDMVAIAPDAAAPAPEGEGDLVPNDADLVTAPAPDGAEAKDISAAPEADGGSNATVWIVVAVIAVVAVAAVVVISKKKK